MKKIKQTKKAFTLAEVLITLGIIGVVATMTIPTLLTNHQKKQTAIKLQKAYAEIYQALKLTEADHGVNLKDSELIDDKQNPYMLIKGINERMTNHERIFT